MKLILLFAAFLFFSLCAKAQSFTEPALLSAIKENNFIKAKGLIEKGAAVNATDSNHASMLMWAVYKSDLQMVQYLVSKGANAKKKGVIYLDKEKTGYYGSLVGLAAGEGKIDVLKFLIEDRKIDIEDKEYDPETKMENGWTALQWAASKGRINAVKYLTEKGADINTNHTIDKGTPLIYAVQSNNVEACRLLIEKGADINAATNEGFTPLMLAVFNNNLELCILLWQNKAVFNLKNASGKTAADIALEKEHSRITDFLNNPEDFKNLQNKLYWKELNTQVIELYKGKEFEKAIPVAMQAVEAAKIEFGENSTNYATALNNLAALHKSMAVYEKALPLYLQVKEIKKKTVGVFHPDYVATLVELGSVYLKMNNYKNAETCYVELADYYKKQTDLDSSEYARQLNYLGLIYAAMDSAGKAATCYEDAVAIMRNNNTDEYFFEAVLFNLANFYDKQKKYEQAEPLFIELVNVQKKLYGSNSQDYIKSIESLAFLFRKNIKYKEAVLLRQEAAAFYKKNGTGTLEYSNAISNLAVLYNDIGLYAEAETYYLQAIEIDKAILGENHLDYATDLYNLSAVYKNIGQLQNAAVLLNQAKEIRKKALGEKHPDYGACLNDLANICADIGLYDEAIKLFLEVKEVWKNAYGTEHPYYAILLHNMAVLYHKKNELQNAEPLYMEAKAMREKVLGQNHPDYANSLQSLAVFYLDTKQYKKSEEFSILVKDIFKKVYGDKNDLYASAINNLAYLYETTEEYEKAAALFTEYQDIETKNLLTLFAVLSEKEKENYLTNKLYLNNNSNNLIYNYRTASPQFYNDNYNLQLFLKALLLSGTQNVLAAVRSSKDSAVQQIFSLWRSNKTTLAKQYVLPIAQRIENLSLLETETEKLEKELSRKSSGFRRQQQGFQIKTTDLKLHLKESEAAIEFVRFQLYDKKWTDSFIYAAYIIRKNDAVPLFIPLCEEKQLQHLFDSAGNTVTSMVNKFYRGVEKLNKNAASLGKDLYKLVWAPLEPYLKGIKKISYSPAGKLYSIAFQALPADSTLLLIDKYNLQQTTSTRQVVLRTEEDQITKPSGITLFGDASFTMDSLQMAKQNINKQNISPLIYAPQKRTSNNGTWAALPGTAEEVKKIGALFNQNMLGTKYFVKTAASEENLKALSGHSPQVLHIATHGFFLPEPDKKKNESAFNENNIYAKADDPLLRSGLLLAGGNDAWAGKPTIDGVEDGIATAYEISQLNLSNTELVVLSACETALGDVKGSEGVFGLQRAFKMAGVKKMIVSLWQVPDKETAELMTIFYTYWMKGKTINESFTQAQAEMRKKYSPYYWAAFVLVE